MAKEHKQSDIHEAHGKARKFDGPPPSVGRMVNFHRGGVDHVAIVLRLQGDDKVNIAVLNDTSKDPYTSACGHTDYQYDVERAQSEPEEGKWNWPEFVRNGA